MATTRKAKAVAASNGKGSRRSDGPRPKTEPAPRPASASTTQATPAKPSTPEDTETQRGRADQLGAILAKGLDLAEAGLSLGLTVIRRVGSVAQEAVFDRFAPGPPMQPGAPDAARAGAAGSEPWTPPASAPAPLDVQAFGIANRMPITPGGAVHVSFSINNDSMAAPKRVGLRVEGFTGEASGGRLSGDLFTVKPAVKTIAPMDFEKFVLAGEVPRDVLPDVYHGWIVVSSSNDFTIPVRLVVSP